MWGDKTTLGVSTPFTCQRSWLAKIPFFSVPFRQTNLWQGREPEVKIADWPAKSPGMASDNAGEQAHSTTATTVESAVRGSMRRRPWNQRGRPLNHHNKENPALVLTSHHSISFISAIVFGSSRSCTDGPRTSPVSRQPTDQRLRIQGGPLRRGWRAPVGDCGLVVRV